MLADNGSVPGVFSTHFAQANQHSERMGGALDRNAAKMAGVIAEEDREKSANGRKLFAPWKFWRHMPA